VNEAVRMGPDGTIVALAAGRYLETLSLTHPASIRGPCAARAVIDGSGAALVSAAVTVTSEVELRDLSLVDSQVRGVRVTGAGAALRMEGVVVSGAREVGVFVEGRAGLFARALVVRDTRAGEPDGTFGRGLVAQSGASVMVERVLLERNRDVGAYASGPGTALTMMDAIVRDTRARESDGAFGRGLSVQSAASAVADRALFDGNRDTGVYVHGTGTVVTLSHAVVRNTLAQESDGTGGRGLAVQSGATAGATRVLIDHNRDVGVFAQDVSTTLTLDDAVVRDTQSQLNDGTSGRGLDAEDGSAVVASRVLFERNRDVGIYANVAGTTLTLEDAIVRDTQGRQSDGAFGRGLSVEAGASVAGARTLLERNRDSAVSALGAGTMLTLEDAVLRDTMSQDSDGTHGRGISLQAGASAHAVRVVLERNRQVGAYADGDGTTLTLEDAIVRDTSPAECGALCVFGAGAVGVGCFEGAAVRAERFVVSRAALCGVQVALGGALDLSNGEVRESAIGACVQVPGYRLSRLNASVIYVGNGANLEATDFPVPERSDASGGL